MSGRRYAVLDKVTGEIVACHLSRPEAKALIRALQREARREGFRPGIYSIVTPPKVCKPTPVNRITIIRFAPRSPFSDN